jgi:uncharacterized membrane protein
MNRLLPGATHLQNLHPLVVHFPIALLSAAVLLYFLAAIVASDSIRWTALWMLVLGTASAALSVATGLYASGGVMVATSVRTALLDHHRNLMIATSVVGGVLTVWAIAARPMPSRGRYVFLLGLLVMLALLTRGADYGGRLVFDYNAGGNACSQPIDFIQ